MCCRLRVRDAGDHCGRPAREAARGEAQVPRRRAALRTQRGTSVYSTILLLSLLILSLLAAAHLCRLPPSNPVEALANSSSDIYALSSAHRPPQDKERKENPFADYVVERFYSISPSKSHVRLFSLLFRFHSIRFVCSPISRSGSTVCVLYIECHVYS